MIATILGPLSPQPAQATSDGSPYQVPAVVDSNPDPGVVETTIVADEATVDIGGGVMADAQTFNGSIPGPEFQLTVGQRVVVHFENHLDNEATGIHWHGIELSNSMDGVPLTQNQVPPGGSFTYDFVVHRPGVFWYHPHHQYSTNQVFKGMYGSIIVTDPNQAALISSGTLPSTSDTHTLVLSDLTVCKAPGSNDTITYDLTLPWSGGPVLHQQPSPTPHDLCEDDPIDHDGLPMAGDYAAGEVPSIQRNVNFRVNEGQTVLTNGMNVGGRAGSPTSPGAIVVLSSLSFQWSS
jgi:FtsP/CotA-like multicopper oxidase with cupredoxin domain